MYPRLVPTRRLDLGLVHRLATGSALAGLAVAPAILLSAPAAAHFVLQSPPASFEQNQLGDPQKAPPCGDAGSAVPTGSVTAVQAGDTITVTIDETIYHPGHYRIALALDDGTLPEPPPVTPGATPCGSAPIDPAPAFPVLADGVWEHTQPFGEPQSIEITIPDDVECTACTLQIIQFMSDHALNDPGGCYYHHCATLTVEADPVSATTSGGDETGDDSTGGGPSATTTAADDSAGNDTSGGPGNDTTDPSAGTTASVDTDPGQAPDDTADGCSCSLQRGDPGRAPWALLGLVGLVGLRLRRRA